MRGVVCGTVAKSPHPDYAEGAIVSGLGVWADYQIGTLVRVGEGEFYPDCHNAEFPVS